MHKRVILAVTNDLEGDQRLYKVVSSLIKNNYAPAMVGRLLPVSGPITWPCPVKRFRMIIQKGPFFYLFFNFRLFFYLLVKPADILVANDLDTLLAVFLAARIKRCRLIYDSHEYFTEVPELTQRPGIKRIWERLEKWLFPKLDHVITVNQTIAEIYQNKYQVPVQVVRNLPHAGDLVYEVVEVPEGFSTEKLMVYQGAVNIGRGLEQVLDAMVEIPEITLMIIGRGDIFESLQEQTRRLSIEDRVWFVGRVPFHDLPSYTRLAKVGISLEQDLGLNYRYALPNKLFDYMRCGIPVIASDLPEISRIVMEVGFGLVVQDFDPTHLAESIRRMFADEKILIGWSQRALARSADYSWESDEPILLGVYRS